MEAEERLAESEGDRQESEGAEDNEKKTHEGFMREALAMAELALSTNETPVGCVFVLNGTIIGRGMNATNRTMNGTRHAEFIAIADILSTPADVTSAEDSPEPGPEPGLSGHPVEAKGKYDSTILQKCDLYVTVEPCIMCASLLRQYQIKKVYFGASNDRFGGTGGVLSIHQDGVPEPKYEVSGGWLREEAIMMLRRFYVQQNNKAPEPKVRKKGDRKLKTDIEPVGMGKGGSATKGV